ncbi:MAG: sulfate adenylyltransferase subunit CysN [Pseudomonadota bacterium]
MGPAAETSVLRFITCGSVDDGKSTLLGRLLYDTRLVPDDQLAALEGDSRCHGTQAGGLDFALLVDGLQSEREQGITIDVAYRYFSTARRRFVVADTPGHEEYTRNMATGASSAQAAVLLVDARKGLLPQTRRHSFIVSLMGIRHVVVAVNKMDLVDWDEVVFERIAGEYRAFAQGLGDIAVTCIPVSALHGDNLTRPCPQATWYKGPSLLEWLETVEVDTDEADKPFRMPVQWVNRPNSDFRGYCGTIASGAVRPGDAVMALPSGRGSRVRAIVTADGELAEAFAGQAVTLTLEDEIDVTRGDVLADLSLSVADQFAAHVVWMHPHAMMPHRRYLFRLGTAEVAGQITELKYRYNVNTMEQQPAKTLSLNDIGFCNVALEKALPFEPYADNRTLGAFIIIDRLTNATVGAGTIAFPLRRASNIGWQPLTVDKAARSALLGQKPCVVWFTGLSGSGKSTIANLVEQKLHAMGRHTYLLDGDNVRHGLNKDLGFTEADRVENIRRVAEVSKLFVDAGLIVLVSFISPFRAERTMARDLIGTEEFAEVYVSTSLEECERRDPKGLYRRARKGEIKNFTGLDSPYEPPLEPTLVLRTEAGTPEVLADEVIAELARRGSV